MSTGDSPTFYLNGQRLNEFNHQSGIKTWKRCNEQRNVESDELTLVYDDIYVQTDALNTLLSKRYNQFNLIWCSRARVFDSNLQVQEVNVYLACPTNGDALSHTPQEEFEDCRYLQKDELYERYADAVNEANESYARESREIRQGWREQNRQERERQEHERRREQERRERQEQDRERREQERRREQEQRREQERRRLQESNGWEELQRQLSSLRQQMQQAIGRPGQLRQLQQQYLRLQERQREQQATQRLREENNRREQRQLFGLRQ